MLHRTGWLSVGFSLVCIFGMTAVAQEAKPEAEQAPEAQTTPEASKPSEVKPLNDDDDYQLVQTLVDVIDEVERHYVKDIDRKELLKAAIRGVMSKLDPYSNYIPPDEIAHFKESLESEFGGIGLQVGDDQGAIKVISPIVGAPAYKAGVRAGDRIVEVDGKSTRGMSLSDVTGLLKGKVGTEVTFSVVRVGDTKPVQIKVKREIIQVETVMGDRRNSDDSWDFFIDHDRKVAYIRMTAFSRDTTRLLRQALDRAQADGMRGLVLDLRFNPGGLLTAAVETCDFFLESGRIVSTEDRGGKKTVFEAKKPGTYRKVPMAVLVNRFSASASEVVSACLQDHKAAVVIGERTWGKGSVQNVIELPSGGALKLTTAGYFRPSGKNIHRTDDTNPDDEWGVMPDEGFKVQLSDQQMAELIRARARRDIVYFRVDDVPPEEDPTEKFVDLQLERALQHIDAELVKAGAQASAAVPATPAK